MSARIVILDKDAENRAQAAAFLEGRGYDIDPCATSQEVLASLKEKKADIVLLDADINEIQGTEIIMEAKERNPEVSIILIGTQSRIEKNPNMLMFAGYEYALKPLRNDVLCACIEQRLNQQHLYRISSALSVTLDVGQVLNLLLETTLREVGADHAVILLREDRADVLRIEAAKGFSNGVVGTTCELDETSILRLIFFNNEPIVLQGGFVQLPFLPEKFSKNVSSSICAPIRIGGNTMGILNVNRMNPAEPFCQSNVRTIEIVALQTAVALQNARAHRDALERQKIEQELDLARSIQQSLFPRVSGCERYAEIVFKNIPAHMIGGDFFDFIQLGPDRFGLAIGDVSGKGVPGALLMVRAISNFRLRASPEKDPGMVLAELNNDLFEGNTHGMYVTGIYAIFDFGQGILRLANAGHPPPALCRSSSKTTECPTSSGIPMGILRNYDYETVELAVECGDLIFFYTDGLIEARSPNGEEFSRVRLNGLLKSEPPFPQSICERLLSELTVFTDGSPPHDDLTLLAVGIKHIG